MNTLLTSFKNTQKNTFQHSHDNRVFRGVPKVIIVLIFLEQTTGKKTKFFNLLNQTWEI